MKRGNSSRQSEAGITSLLEYLFISAVLMILFVIMLLMVNTNFMEGPANTLAYSAFTDIGNGVSTRIVDTYAIAPSIGNITSRFDIPDDVAGRNYFVEIGGGSDPTAQIVTVWRDSVSSSVSLAGVGSTKRAGGNTTGMGLNVISYDSEGF